MRVYQDRQLAEIEADIFRLQRVQSNVEPGAWNSLQLQCRAKLNGWTQQRASETMIQESAKLSDWLVQRESRKEARTHQAHRVGKQIPVGVFPWNDEILFR